MNWDDIIDDPDLLKYAAMHGDVDFLRSCAALNIPQDYYLTYFDVDDDDENFGNIFHLAIEDDDSDDEGEKFIREAITKNLRIETTKKLLLKQLKSSDGVNKWNPLHTAAYLGKINIVKMFLDVYKEPFPTDHSERPWLQKNEQGQNPCFIAFEYNEKECGIEILNKDIMELSKTTSNDGTGLLYNVVSHSYEDAALMMLNPLYPFVTDGPQGSTPLHCITECSEDEGVDIFKKLLQKEPGIIKRKTNQDKETIFHSWAGSYEIWPFMFVQRIQNTNQDLSKDFAELVTLTDNDKNNPLHTLVSKSERLEEDMMEVAKLLIQIHKQSPSGKTQTPLLAKNKEGHTPLSLALEKSYEHLAMNLLKEDVNAVIQCKENAFFMAIKYKCTYVAERILDVIVKENKWSELLTNDKKETALHLAPLLNKNKTFFNQLLNKYPSLLKNRDEDENTVLHYWLREGGVWQLEDLLTKKDECRFEIIKQLEVFNKDQDNPLHVAANSTNETNATLEAVKLLVKAYREDNRNWPELELNKLPWFSKNKDTNEGPLHSAIRQKNDNFALYILELYEDHGKDISKLLDNYPKTQTLFLAVNFDCPLVTQKIFEKLNHHGISRNKYLIDSSTGQTVLHLAPKCKDEKLQKILLANAAEFIGYKDKKNKRTPLAEACQNADAAWFINEIRQNHREEFDKEPMVWVNACKKGHLKVIEAFTAENNIGPFRDLCLRNRDTPLHNIQFKNLWEYEEFLKIKHMDKDLLNLQNSNGETPLHIAIKTGNIDLTQTLLAMENIRHDIQDYNSKKTAKELLKAKYKIDDWKKMCLKIGFEPNLTTSYFEQRKTKNMFEVRNSLSVVAALLATITFTAGFTLPGGLEDGGEAVLALRTSFYVFLITNTLAMCSSMLVLICLVWSMVQSSNDNPNHSLVLIDRSMIILMASFIFTLLAFMSGVYLVISHKVIWLAIIIIVMCSLIGISAAIIVLVAPSKKIDKQSKKEIDERKPSTNPNDDNNESSSRGGRRRPLDEESTSEADSNDEDPENRV